MIPAAAWSFCSLSLHAISTVSSGTAGNKVGEIQEYDGRTRDSYLGILYLLLDFFGLGIVAMALIQNELNKVAGL